MESVIALIDATSCAVFLAAILVVIAKSLKKLFRPDSAFFMISLIGIYVFVQFSNVLEHLGITARLDYYEDFAEMLFPFFFIAFMNSLRLHADIEHRMKNERELDAMLKGRTELLKEIHHRVKNNLQVVLSIISLRRRQKDVDDKAQEMLMATESRIFSMASVHEVIYKFQDPREIPISGFLRPIIYRAARTVPGGRGEGIQTLVDIPQELCLRLEMAVPLGLLVNELVSNAFRNSVHRRPAGLVAVHVTQENGMATLVVKDNGPHAHEESPPEGELALSSLLIRDLVLQLGGALHVSTDEGNVVSVQFQLADHGT
jgi:two-component sensor histidine kinase